jgi:hypothetical protein
MDYDIYFHNDFDGRASAAVMLAFLRSRGENIKRYRSMTYGKEKAWYKENYLTKGNPAIVVDFTYHPKAAWWFDHHPTTFKKPEWRKRFVPDAQHHLEPNYVSCTHLVYAVLKKEFSWTPPKHFGKFVEWANKIDGAGYRSAKETIAMKDPGVLMNAYVEALPHTEREDKHMIELMAEKPLEEVVKDPGIARALAGLKKKVSKSLAYQKRRMQSFERSTFVDLTRDPLNGLLRFAPYYFYPKKIYSFRMRPKGKLWYLGLQANPWHRAANKMDIGALMREYGGGGHKDVGATEFGSRTKAEEAFREMNLLLNQ